jgi:hypothetical protein
LCRLHHWQAKKKQKLEKENPPIGTIGTKRAEEAPE